MNTDHLQQCADAGYEAIFPSVLTSEERLAFARAAISTYLKLNPVWVGADEKMPAREDADKEGFVFVWSNEEGGGVMFYENLGPNIYWTSIKHLPPPPDPFEDWLAQQPDDVRAADKELVKKIYNLIKQ